MHCVPTTTSLASSAARDCDASAATVDMRRVIFGVLAVLLGMAASARAAERLCDPAGEDCRAILLNLIRNEPTQIDVAFWFMEDSRYSAEIIRRFQAGVRVRVLVDARANAAHPLNQQILDQLSAAGIPMRQRVASGILHWKMMLFAAQGQVEFSGANYSPYGLVSVTPYSNYEEEAIMFSDEPATLQSFMKRYDDLWTDTASYADYANIAGAPARSYPEYPISSELNFPPADSYRNRAVAAYNAEPAAIDVTMFRITDRAHTDAIIAAVNRGVKVRLLTEQSEYRNPDRLWDSWNVDRMCAAGVAIRQRAHDGLNHQKSVILRGQQMAIFGSSNWTSPSNQSQEEHNEFTTKPYVFQWFVNQFDRKWNNTGPSPESAQFVPLPPDAPVNAAPANGATRVSTTPAITFDAGPFAHLYDIYLGTTSNPGLIAADVALGPTAPGDAPRSYQLPELAPGTTYYWKVVARTMARQQASGAVWRFTTAGKTGPAPAPLPSPAAPAPPVTACGDDAVAPSPSPSPAPSPSPSPSPVPSPSPSPAPAPAPSPTPTPQPAMHIDLPGNGATVREPFALSGWAFDAAATSGNGIDIVHLYAYPASGAPPIFLGAASVNGARPDVAAYVGQQFTYCGFGLVVRGLAPGDYTLVAYGRSTVAGTFAIAQTVSVRIQPSAMVVIDIPSSGAVLGSSFVVAGWAADFAAASGGGIDIVQAYAYPASGAAPLFLGQASVDIARPDVASYAGSQFGQVGYGLVTAPISPGSWRIVVYGRSLVTGTFSAVAVRDVVVR